jgi:UDP-N-acetylglucosamine 2-epimerase (non-hydrolysing)
MARRVCVVTGTRAEYGLLYWLMHAIRQDGEFELQVVATAMHLEPAFGHTVDLIRQDGFTVDAEVPMQLTSDAPVEIAKSTGLAVGGLAEAFKRLRPDIIVLLGDRFETLAAASAAALMRVPVAHIHGGEISEGAIDDAFRHAITKLSHLHFVAADPFRKRVIQMGESPERVFTVGSPGLDNLVRLQLPTRVELGERLGLDLPRPMFLVTYHPATLDDPDPLQAVEELLAALDRFREAVLVFTKANADTGGRAINDRLAAYVAQQPGRSVLVASLGQQFYLAALKEAAVVIGNSSSGLIEAPAVGTPTVNLGIRQKGRPRAASVIDCAEECGAIERAIRRALDPSMRAIIAADEPPYGRPRDAAGSILESLRSVDLGMVLHKRFHERHGAMTEAAVEGEKVETREATKRVDPSLTEAVLNLLTERVPGFSRHAIETPFTELEVDSFAMLELRTDLELVIGRQISDPDWTSIVTTKDLLTIVQHGEGSSAEAKHAGHSAKRRYCLNMPQMAQGGMGEGWLFKEAGDLHWAMITAGLGVSSSNLRDGNGNRLYATFTRFRIEASQPLLAFQENEDIELAGDLSRYGAGLFFSRNRLTGERRKIELAIMSSFAKRGSPGSNIDLLQGQPSIQADCPIPPLSEMPSFGAEYRDRRNRGCSSAATIFECDYDIIPVHDINGVGLLYFAAYPMISDICELRFLKERSGPAMCTSTSLRDVFYFANCDPTERLIYRVHAFRESNSRIEIESSLSRSSDGALMAYLVTGKDVFVEPA